MAQGFLPFKYESEEKTTGMTALGGLPVYLDLAQLTGLSKSVQQHLKVRTGGQGWTDAQMVLALVLLNLAGGDCVEDIKFYYPLHVDNTKLEVRFNEAAKN